MVVLARRQNYNSCDYLGNCTDNGGSWDNWVRWVVLVAVILVFLLVFFGCSYRSAKRRRQHGQQPFYGTGWSARPQDRQPYYNNTTNTAPPPPQYSADMPAGHQGYYGQQNGVELQPPAPSYAPGRETDIYEPPVGPPPAKGTKGSDVIH